MYMLSMFMLLLLSMCLLRNFPKIGQSTNAFFILNHFLEDIFPSYEDAEIINQMEILQDRTELCSNANDSKTVNLLAVDFWSVGEVAQFVLEHNKSLL